MRCKISNNEWLDLALIRRIQFETEPPLAVITWFDGSTQVYNGSEATTVINGWLKANTVPDDSLDSTKWREEKEREIIQILRRRGGRMFLLDLLEISDVPYSVLGTLNLTGQVFIQHEMIVLARPDSESA